MRDELWQVKCLYSTGAYQAAINTANQIQTTTLNSLKLFYICRCYLAQKKFSLVINELKSAGEPMLKAVLAYAKYLSTSTKSSSITDRKKLLDEMMQLLEQSGQPQIAQLAAELLIGDGDYKAAAECLAPHLSTDIEWQALIAL